MINPDPELITILDSIFFNWGGIFRNSSNCPFFFSFFFKTMQHTFKKKSDLIVHSQQKAWLSLLHQQENTFLIVIYEPMKETKEKVML